MIAASKPALALICTLTTLIAISCGSSDGATSAPPTAASVEASPPASGDGTPASSSSAPSSSALPASIRLQRAFGNLSFERLTGLYATPLGGGLWLATEQAGRVMLVNPNQNEAGIFLDIRDRVSTDGSEEGLLGLALAPDFASSGIFYVYYSAKPGPRRTVVSRFRSGGNAGLPESETVLLEFAQPFPNHKGGQIAFGPDGFLYIGLGDGGSARDPMGNGQNTNVLLGKILRIDVGGSEGGRNYRIPADNPFVGRAGDRPEIWAYGLRNPWRFSFDKQGGALWVGDVGQNAREEINVVTKGGNYGWGVTEGSMCLGGGNNCDRTGMTLPVLEYATGANCSVSGGFVYRGSAIPSLQGAYLYADYCSGRIWALRYDGSRVVEQKELLDADIQISSFAQDNAGELYVLAHAANGGIFRIVP